MAQGKPAQNIPAGAWSISKDDKRKIRELGKELDKFLAGYKVSGGVLETKIVVGAFDYVSQMINLRSKIISDRYLYLRECVQQKGLEAMMAEFEPFQDKPEDDAPEVEDIEHDAKGHPTPEVPPATAAKVNPAPQPAK